MCVQRWTGAAHCTSPVTRQSGQKKTLRTTLSLQHNNWRDCGEDGSSRDGNEVKKTLLSIIGTRLHALALNSVGGDGNNDTVCINNQDKAGITARVSGPLQLRDSASP
nr:hypothetical protein CFP56_16840 [Quercus suber]